MVSIYKVLLNLGIIFVSYFLGVDNTQASENKDQPERGYAREVKGAVTADKFMVSTANPIATKAGYKVLLSGGSAIDAVVAIQMVLNVVEPQSSGIGGGAFILYWDAKKQQLYSFDGRETAPKSLNSSYFIARDGRKKSFWDAVQGGGSVGVPGTLRLMELVHQRYGIVSWSELFQPAIQIAREGFVVSPRLAKSISRAQKRGLDRFPVARAYFFNKDLTPKLANSRLVNLPLAETFGLISRSGANIFYEGSLAHSIVTSVNKTKFNPGHLTLDDLAGYQVKERKPVCVPYKDYEVCGMGSPSSGGLTVGQILGILENFDLEKQGSSLKAAHLFIEASKLAYADRNLYMADKDFIEVPEIGLIDKEYLSNRAQLITDSASGKATAGYPKGSEGLLRSLQQQNERPGTTHYVVVDKYGNAASVTSTIETGFGSRVMVGGFLLNNELTDFSFVPDRNGRLIANRVQGGKRPRSSMAPTVVLKEGKPFLITGSPGGSRIISYVARTILNVLEWGLDPQAAINSGHIVNRNGVTELEEGTDAINLKEGLESLGHKVKIRNLNSGLHSILFAQDGTLIGAADPRREGLVMGE